MFEPGRVYRPPPNPPTNEVSLAVILPLDTKLRKNHPKPRPRLPLPSGPLSAESRPRRPQRKYYRRKADAIYELQMREFVVRRRVAGASWKAIASEAVQSQQTVKRYFRLALERHVAMTPYDPLGERYDDDVPLSGPPPITEGEVVSPPPHATAGEVLDPPDEVVLQDEILDLMKRAVPTSEIARRLGITEREANRLGTKRLQQIADAETFSLDHHRRMMVMQLDDMIHALYDPATGRHPEKGQVAPVLEATDRLMKLLRQKAELMGLNHPQTEDIALKLYRLAEIYQYDIEELQEVAKDVLGAHRIKPLGRRVQER